MGSEVFAALDKIGLKRGGGGESCEGPPEAVTIIGLDITAEALLRRYPDDTAAHRRACAIIRGVRDRTRTAEPPPEWFIQSVGEEQEEPVAIAYLGPDAKGKPVVVVCKGRQRTMALRAWNARQKPHDRRNLFCVTKALRNTANIDAEIAALESNARSNLHVAMRPSQVADHAAMMKEKRIPVDKIAIKLGLRDETAVRHHLALAALCPAVWGAVDAGTYPIAECMALVAFDDAGNATAKYDEEEQARRVMRAVAAPKGTNGKAAREARDKAAPPRPKAMPPRPKAMPRAQVIILAETFEGMGRDAYEPVYSPLDVAAMLRHVLREDGAAHTAGLTDGMREILCGKHGKEGGA